jgi:L-malate glycosyltransferase
LRILQLIQKPQLRGAEIFASQLSNHLVAAGHEVKMICLLDGNATLPFSGEVMSLKRPLSKRFIDWAGWKMLANEITAFKPDVVQANAGDTLKFAVFSKVFFSWKAPIIFRNANKVSEFVTTRAKRMFNKFLVSRVSHVISVSELCRQDFVKTYSFAEGKTTTVPIGIETQSINSTVPADLVSVFASSNVFVHVASFVPEKNHQGLLRIVRKLVDAGEHIHVLLIGDGRLRSFIENQINELKLREHVTVAGYRNDVLAIISNAKAFVLPSNIEGLPGVLLEAMYCQTPVVAYDVGGVSEIIRSGETGWLVKSGDEAEFVAAIQQAIHTDTSDICSNAKTQVVNEFDNKVIANRFLEVYKKVTVNT